MPKCGSLSQLWSARFHSFPSKFLMEAGRLVQLGIGLLKLQRSRYCTNSFESCGIPPERAKAISRALRNFSDGILENISNTHLSKRDMKDVEILRECSDSRLKSDLKDSNDWCDENIQNDIKKLRYEFNGTKTSLDGIEFECLKYCMVGLLSMFAIGMVEVRKHATKE